MLRAALTVSLVIGAALHDPSCGDVESPSSGVNAPCTRDHDCHAGLACSRGVCVSGDAGAEAGAEAAASPDASGDASGDAGGDVLVDAPAD